MTSIATQSALTGLKVAQKALDTISTNIANASTEGYTRKILPQETLIVMGTGSGVRGNSLIRNVDQALMRDLFKQQSITSNTAVQEQFLSRIQEFHGSSDAEKSLSAGIGRLADSFAELSAAPNNSILLEKTLQSAQNTARNINDFAKMLYTLRNDAEQQITTAVNEVNQSLDTIAALNKKIAQLSSAGKSTADLEDQRDMAISKVSTYLQISTFRAEDNKIVVMTRQGHVLADENARPLYYEPSHVAPTSHYPNGGLSTIRIDGAGGLALEPDAMGGQLGGLFTLRDQTIPTYQAQIDEMAQKMAERFDQQGLRLFTDAYGNVPASTTPPTPVSYVGFANSIRVNNNIVNDPSLIRTGTTGATILAGSNEIIQKVSEYVFGSATGEIAGGTADISTGTIFAATGLTQTNRVIGNMNIAALTPDLSAAPNLTLPAAFDLTIGTNTYTVTINPGDTATDLVNTINTAVGSPVAALNSNGQLRINATEDITIADNATTPIGAAGMADLGFAFGTTIAESPRMVVTVGQQSPVSVTINPGDTATDLLAALNAIDGLTATLNGSGQLIVTPENGGGIHIAEASGTPMQALGLTIQNVSHTPFRSSGLGPAGDISTNLDNMLTLEEFARGLISSQAADHKTMSDNAAREESFHATLSRRNQDQSGVNIDEEVTELIRIQTAYSAAARMVSAVETMLDDLFTAFTF